MTMPSSLPETKDTVRWYHKLLALPIRLLTALNLGPFGGDSSVSAVIEAALALRKGEAVDFELSKSDRFLVEKTANVDIDELKEYRELNHAVQEEILRRWSDKILAVVWIGAGVFTLEHPLLAKRKTQDWHIWTDAEPKIVRSAEATFNEMLKRGAAAGLSYHVMLPQDVETLNKVTSFVTQYGVEHLVIFGYGVSYALTMQENYEWLSKLKLPDEIDVSFVFNSPGPKPRFVGALMAAAHRQRVVYYERQHIEALFQATIPGSEIVWSVPREQTRHKVWEVWLIHRSAPVVNEE